MRKLLLFIMLIWIFVPIFVSAQTACSQNYSGTTLCNAIPSIAGAPITDIPSLIQAIFTWLASVIGTIALVMVMFSGAQMILSRGEPAAVLRAKTSLTYSIVGLLTIVLAYVLVSAVQFFIGFNNVVQPGQQPGGFFKNPIKDTELMVFVNSTILNLLGLLGTVAMGYIVFAGFRYVTAGSNEEQTKKARQGLTWAILGLICVVLSYLIVVVVLRTVIK